MYTPEFLFCYFQVWNLSTSTGWNYEKDFHLSTGTGHFATVVVETNNNRL